MTGSKVTGPDPEAQYLVSFGSSLGAFNGTVTTSPDLNQITGFTGTFGGNPVALLPSGSFAGNDNLFSSTSPYVDSHGIAFSSGGTLFLERMNVISVEGAAGLGAVP